MAGDQSDDPILDALVDGTVYDRVRVERIDRFTQPIPRKLAIQSALLGSLTLLLPLYALYPRSAGPYIPSLDPLVASPKIIFLGLFGGAIQIGTAGVLAGAVIYRARHAPLTERQAHSVLDAETFATYLGFGTGGLAIVLTLVFFLLGLGGEASLTWYIETLGGTNPFAASGVSVTVAHVAGAAMASSVLLVGLRAYLETCLQRVTD